MQRHVAAARHKCVVLWLGQQLTMLESACYRVALQAAWMRTGIVINDTITVALRRIGTNCAAQTYSCTEDLKFRSSWTSARTSAMSSVDIAFLTML